MKVIILCGGKGLRMSEVTKDIPKPLASINGKAILWHIMNCYYKYGFNDFVLLLGYKGEKIKEYFINQEWRDYDFILDNRANKKTIHLLDKQKRWRITFVDTGEETMTGSRIKLAEKYIDGDTFLLTYGDGLSDVNIRQLLDYHIRMGKIATLTGVQGKSQYGLIKTEKGLAIEFKEKPDLPMDRVINGGFFVLNKKIMNYLWSDGDCVFETKPLMTLCDENQLAVYHHKGFWNAVDTYKDLKSLNREWDKIEKILYISEQV